ECDLALAGGARVDTRQDEGYLAQEGMIFSLDGHCRPFDARAEGTVFGSGVGLVVLKRLAEALADRDSVRAVIRGSAINNDGGVKVGYTAPGVEGQAAVIRAAQLAAQVDPATVTYVEAHGTGTLIGDPIEVAALTKAFRTETNRQQFCAIGSVKSNIGHLDAAAGVAGLIKTVLSLERGLLPPSLHFETPNPRIDFEHSPFYVNTELSAWTSPEGPRRAGVSSFGIGGTNCHVVLEQASEQESSASSSRSSGVPRLLVLSAKTDSALGATATNLAEHLERHTSTDLAEVAFTLATGRRRF